LVLAANGNVPFNKIRPSNDYGNENPEVGPWPECVGQSGDWCVQYVGSWVGYASFKHEDRRKTALKIIRPYEYLYSRVWVHCNEEGKK